MRNLTLLMVMLVLVLVSLIITGMRGIDITSSLHLTNWPNKTQENITMGLQDLGVSFSS